MESGSHGGRAAAAFGAIGLLIVTLGINISANSISAANDLMSFCPKYINIRRGQLLAAVIGSWGFVPVSRPAFLQSYHCPADRICSGKSSHQPQNSLLSSAATPFSWVPWLPSSWLSSSPKIPHSSHLPRPYPLTRLSHAAATTSSDVVTCLCPTCTTSTASTVTRPNTPPTGAPSPPSSSGPSPRSLASSTTSLQRAMAWPASLRVVNICEPLPFPVPASNLLAKSLPLTDVERNLVGVTLITQLGQFQHRLCLLLRRRRRLLLGLQSLLPAHRVHYGPRRDGRGRHCGQRRQECSGASGESGWAEAKCSWWILHRLGVSHDFTSARFFFWSVEGLRLRLCRCYRIVPVQKVVVCRPWITRPSHSFSQQNWGIFGRIYIANHPYMCNRCAQLHLYNINFLRWFQSFASLTYWALCKNQQDFRPVVRRAWKFGMRSAMLVLLCLWGWGMDGW